mmetsp:Transcript_61450/g.143823  ORF Transcript_61450/g.143823 Transcript_61450/m.143823 type:complete len:270 (+) Transcript_61450:619-1428(+)
MPCYSRCKCSCGAPRRHLREGARKPPSATELAVARHCTAATVDLLVVPLPLAQHQEGFAPASCTSEGSVQHAAQQPQCWVVASTTASPHQQQILLQAGPGAVGLQKTPAGEASPPYAAPTPHRRHQRAKRQHPLQIAPLEGPCALGRRRSAWQSRPPCERQNERKAAWLLRAPLPAACGPVPCTALAANSVGQEWPGKARTRASEVLEFPEFPRPPSSGSASPSAHFALGAAEPSIETRSRRLSSSRCSSAERTPLGGKCDPETTQRLP